MSVGRRVGVTEGSGILVGLSMDVGDGTIVSVAGGVAVGVVNGNELQDARKIVRKMNNVWRIK